MFLMRLITLAVILCASAPAASRWWMDTPVRLVQTNLRETDATLDPARLARQVAEFPANTLLFGMGGIVAYYPTRVEFHYPSPYLPAGRDLFGDMLREAHARGIRVIGRFDLSKTQKPVYDAHPEWFVRRANGEPVVYNGLYSACINGGYYHRQALEILAEALDRYAVDGLFFNMFGNPSSDYSGRPVGPCQCASCRTRFEARYHRPLPTTADADYRRFLQDSSREVAAMFAELIHRKRPNAAFLTYIQQSTDGIMSESNTAVNRPLPLWPYSASDNVDRARNSEPGKMAFNLSMSFVDFPWRFVTVPPDEIRLRLYQSMAHGAGPALNMHGTMDQEDRGALIAARPVFEWHAAHEDLYVGQQSAARVLLLSGPQAAYRGWFRLLSEQHIPFAVSDNLDWLAARPGDFDLVIVPGPVPAELDGYIRGGGRVVATGAEPPALDLPKIVRRWPATEASFRIHDHALFPSLINTNLLFLNGEYTELQPEPNPPLTLIPPAMFGPPEKVWVDKIETNKPGLLLRSYGKGQLAWVPWDVAGLYYRHSSPGHAGLMADVVDRFLPGGRQVRTDAHPLVEITLMRQPARNRTLLHLVNLSGHSDTAYFRPIPMRNIEVALKGRYSLARSVTLAKPLPIAASGGYSKIVLPALAGYEVLILE